MTERPHLSVFLTTPTRSISKSTDHHYVYHRLPKSSQFVPLSWLPNESITTLASESLRIAMWRVGLRALDRRLFGSAYARRVGRAPTADVAYSYAAFPVRDIGMPVVWEQTFAPGARGADLEAWIERLRRDGRDFAERATRVVTATAASVEVFSQAFPDLAHKVRQVPYFLPELPMIDDEALEAKLTKREPIRVLFVGKQAARKGLDTLVAAAEQLPPKIRERLQFTVVSAMSDGRVACPSDFEVHDYIDDINSVFRAGHVFAFPTKAEAYGLVIVEAMAAGCAILTTDNPLQRSVVGDGGLVSNPHDPTALAGHLRALVEQPELLGELARAARARAATHHTPEVVAEQLYTLLREAAGR